MDGEPPNGDYVAYIDRLVNRGGAQPGSVQPAGRGRAPRIAWPGTSADPAASPAAPAPAPPSGRADPSHASAAARSGSAAPRDTLAARHSRGKTGLLLQAFAAVLALIGLRMLQEAAHTGRGDVSDFFAGGFMLFFAWMLLRAGGRLRRANRAPLPSLPPLMPASGTGGRGAPSSISSPSSRS